MKKTLIILLSCLSLTSLAQGDFREGYNNGWTEGYKDASEKKALFPSPPSAPIPPIGKNSYQGGWNMGFKAGLKVGEKDKIDFYEIGRQSGGGSNSQVVQQKSKNSSGQDDLNKTIADYQAKLDQLKAETQGWEKINDIRWTYTYFGHKFWKMKKRKKKAVEKIDEEALIRGFKYEVITFIEHRAKIGVEPKVIVVIELVN